MEFIPLNEVMTEGVYVSTVLSAISGVAIGREVLSTLAVLAAASPCNWGQQAPPSEIPSPPWTWIAPRC